MRITYTKWRLYLRSVQSKNNVLLCVFLWSKVLPAKDIHREILPVYADKCLSHKTVHGWVKKMFSMWVPRQLTDEHKMNRFGLFLQHLCRYADEGEDVLNRIIT
jgi:hypothetical protein